MDMYASVKFLTVQTLTWMVQVTLLLADVATYLTCTLICVAAL